jgi:hypothetical protein
LAAVFLRKIFSKTLLWLALLIGGLAITQNVNADDTTATHTFVIGTNDFLLDGNRFQIRCGEIHAARVPKEYWRQRLKMAKADEFKVRFQDAAEWYSSAFSLCRFCHRWTG